MPTDPRPCLSHILVRPVLAICLLASACGGEDPNPAEAVAADPVETTTTLPSSGQATGDAGPESTVGAPATDLADAIGALGTSYEFASVVTTPAGDSVSVRGSRIGTSLSYTIDVDGAVVEVIAVDGVIWIRQDPADEWLQSDAGDAQDPLVPLASPVEVMRARDESGRLVATYDPKPLGLGETELVDVRILLGDGEMTFESAAGQAELRTTLVRNEQLPPIVAPVA